jgi:prepilin-type N-terminal cleavage/methylation domain-containing protein
VLGKPCRPGEVPGESGFTLLEVLIGIVLVALIAVGVSAISLSGVVTIKDDSRERQQEATTAQWTSLVFARDVQGASAVTDGARVTARTSSRSCPRTGTGPAGSGTGPCRPPTGPTS